MSDKMILDPCCGSRMWWFNKNNPDVLFGDIRSAEHTLCDGRLLKIAPDMEMDVTALPFADGSFKLVAFDPPHLNKIGDNAWMALKYGKLPASWQEFIRQGLNECMRVAEENGIVIFKWNESQITVKQVLSVIDHCPVLGHTTSKGNKTIWMCFIKH